MNLIPIKCVLDKRLAKTGKEYYVAVLSIAPGVDKIVFLEPSEAKLIQVLNSTPNSK